MRRTDQPTWLKWGTLWLGVLFGGCGRSHQESLTTPSDASTARLPQSLPESSQPSIRGAAETDWFEDVTTQAGVDFRYQTGRSAERRTILETVGGGVGLIDYNLDSHVDLYAVGGGTIDATTGIPRGSSGKLFRQDAAGRFGDVTPAARLTTSTDYSHGILAGDFDNDGFLDLFLTCFGLCQLWRNLGDGTFEAVAEDAGLASPGWHTASAFGDLNGDGNLDLFVARYLDWDPAVVGANAIPQDVPPPQDYGEVPNRLFLNNGDGRFEDASVASGIRIDGMAMGVIAADLNRDGRPDVCVANDVVANHLYWGSPSFPLRESGELSGIAYNESGNPEGSMGIDAEDVNGDGLPDILVTNFELEDNSLYLNRGNNQFQHASARMGLAGVGRTLVGFGTGFQDFDSDGWPDLYVLNGHVQYQSPRSPFQQPAFVLRNVDGRRFEDVTALSGPWFSVPHTARGGAAGDLNNDGAVDLVISSLDEPLAILRNRLPARPCLRLRLVGVDSSRDPIGAVVSTRYQGSPLVRLVKSGAGYLSQSDPRIVIPIDPHAKFVEITLDWPSGRRELFRESTAAGDHVLVELRGTKME